MKKVLWLQSLLVSLRAGVEGSSSVQETLSTCEGQEMICSQPGFTNANVRLRPLVWGQLNIIHTTDTHGWLPGHLLQPEFSSDWGDYISFVDQMRRRADEKGVDVLVVDTGDRHDGNGLSDATDVDGEVSQRVFMEADLDVVTLGNHELYKPEIIEQEHRLFSKHFGNRFLTSNVDIWDGDKQDWVPVGRQYKIITTKNLGMRVLTFGFLYEFNLNCKNSRVRKIEEVAQEPWFLEALDQEFDTILLATHIPLRHFEEMPHLIKTIRERHPHKPIQVLGGHTHVRDATKPDPYTMALESGRFLETVGWSSFQKVDDDDVTTPPIFNRSYIDFNLKSLTTHSDTSLDPTARNYFHTEVGKRVSNEIDEFRQQLNLTHVLGCVDQDYYMNRIPFPHQRSIYTLIQDTLLPKLERKNDEPRAIFVNTGSVRHDLFKGPFSVDSGFIVSPFPSRWLYIPNFPARKIQTLQMLLNHKRQVVYTDHTASRLHLDYSDLGVPASRDLHDDPHAHLTDLCPEVQHNGPMQQHVLSALQAKLTGGYVTHDELGHHGDDTPHIAWHQYPVPNVILSKDDFDFHDADDKPNNEPVDLVFNDYMKPFILSALNSNEHETSVLDYGGNNVIDLLSDNFACEECECGQL